jgi:hypothetical protein
MYKTAAVCSALVVPESPHKCCVLHRCRHDTRQSHTGQQGPHTKDSQGASQLISDQLAGTSLLYLRTKARGPCQVSVL